MLFYLFIAFLGLSLPLSLAFFFAMMLTLRPWTWYRVATMVFFLASFIWLPLWHILAEGVGRDLGLGSAFESISFTSAAPLAFAAALLVVSTRSLLTGLPPFLFAALSVLTALNPSWQEELANVLVIPTPAVGAVSILPTLAIWTAVTRYREPHAGRPFVCQKCGYNVLSINARRCPECGTVFGGSSPSK